MADHDQGRRSVVYVSGCAGDTQRYRCQHAAAQLRLRGHRADIFWHTDPAALEAAAQADLVVLHRPPETHFLTAIMQAAAGSPIVYESDDLIFRSELVDELPIVRESQGMERQYWRNYALSNARVLRGLRGAITSSTALAEHLSDSNRSVWIHRNAISDELLALSDRARLDRTRDGAPVIGYFSGTRSHNEDLALVAPVLAQVLERHPQVRLLLGGYLELPPLLEPYAGQIEQCPFVPWQDVPGLMVKADILLAPLNLDNPFARCRSELKYLEAAALGIPLIASPARAFAEAIRQGETGLLAPTLEAWEVAIETLLDDSLLRSTIGEAAAEHVRHAYTFEALAPDLDRTLEQIITTVAPIETDEVWNPALVMGQWQADLRLQGQRTYMLTGCDLGNAANYRCRHPQQQLDLHDLRSVVVSLYDEGFYLPNAITYDMAILHRVAHDEQIDAYLTLMRDMGRPVIFDTDDLVFMPELIDYVDAIKDWPEHEQAQYLEGVKGYRRTLLACDAAIVSTEPLAEAVRALGQRAFVVRNALSWQQIDESAQVAARRLAGPLPLPDDPVVVGYFSGTATHNRDFREVTPALLQLLAEEQRVRLRIVGPLQLDPAFDMYADRIDRRDLVPLVELPAEIAMVDIALAPLELDNPFCQAKSEVKYMEAALAGVPLIASPIEAFRYAITDGSNGMLAATTEEWLAALRSLVADPGRRRALGTAAHEDVLQRYSPAARSRTLLDVLTGLWEELALKRKSTSFNQVFLHSLALYQGLGSQKNQTIASLTDTLASKNQTIASLQQLITAQEQTIVTHNQTIATLQQNIAALQQNIAALQQHQAEAHKAITWLQQTVVATEARATASEQALRTTQELLDRIAQGRLMRTLNALSSLRGRR